MNYYIYLFGNIGLILCIVSILIISLSIQDWASQDSWEGSLLLTSSYYYKDAPCTSSSSKCKVYSRLWKSGLIILSFDILSILSLLSLAYLLFRLVNKSRIPLIIIFSMETSSTVFHFIGYFVWMLMNKATYSNDCKSDESKICAKSGPILGLIILLLMPLQIVCMVFTLKFTRKQKKKKHLRASQDLKNFDSDRI